MVRKRSLGRRGSLVSLMNTGGGEIRGVIEHEVAAGPLPSPLTRGSKAAPLKTSWRGDPLRRARHRGIMTSRVCGFEQVAHLPAFAQSE